MPSTASITILVIISVTRLSSKTSLTVIFEKAFVEIAGFYLRMVCCTDIALDARSLRWGGCNATGVLELCHLSQLVMMEALLG